MAYILVVDDDEMICDALCDLFRPMGHAVDYALTLSRGLERVLAAPYDVVFLDVNLPDGNGLSAIPRFRDAPSDPEVVIITGEGTPDGAELAISNDAWDYLQKPISAKEVKLPLVRVLQYREEKKTKAPHIVLNREGIIGDTPQIKRCLDLMAQASQSEANVILTGETGTGKELFARAIHINSNRQENAFIVVDCAALPANLVESALFGHVKGAFTGADIPRGGMIKEADGGSLFLDEIAELPLEVQSTFLRVLQEKSFRPVGSKKEVRSDFRLIAATNRDLGQMVKDGSFRQDLFFRLQSILLELPPLRERQQDIQTITFHYLSKLGDRYGTGTKGLSPEFMEALTTYAWPGNVRELVHSIEKALASAGASRTLFPIHLPPHIRSQLARDSVKVPTTKEKNQADAGPFPAFRDLMQVTEKTYFEDLMVHTRRDIKAACKISGLSRAQVYKILKKHHI